MSPLRGHGRHAGRKAPGRAAHGKILDVKIAAKEVELYQKLLLAGKFHASFVVIGTLSSRMAGADGLNPQGIKHTKDVRRMFPLSWDGYILCGGDFDSFEVTLADAVYNDPSLRAALCSGKKSMPCSAWRVSSLGDTGDAREYANDDIVYTRALDHHFGDPTPGDDDSSPGLHGGRRPLARLPHRHSRYERVARQGPGGRGQLAGERQQAGRSPCLYHGRDGRDRGNLP